MRSLPSSLATGIVPAAAPYSRRLEHGGPLMLRAISAAYFGGAVGAVANSLAVWLLARADLLAAIGVKIAPTLTPQWLGWRMLWGSLWGLGFPLLTRAGLTPLRAGLALSLAPTAAQLLYFSPRGGHGFLGLELGILSPLVVILANALWGFVLARTVAATGRA